MAPLNAGVECPSCHTFHYVLQVYAPFTDRDLDRHAEKRAVPQECDDCGASLAGCLLQVEGEPREGGVTQPGMKRSGLGAGNGKEKVQEGPLTPSDWRGRVFERQRPRVGAPALCAVTGESLSEATDEVHHPVEKSWLRSQGLHAYVWDPRNGMAVKKRIHERHTTRHAPIAREHLPAGVYDFIRGLPGRYAAQALHRLEDDHPTKEE